MDCAVPGLGHLSQKDAGNARKFVVQHFIQECMVPRAKLSPIDASYCARFIRVMHNVGAGNFPSLHVYDRVSTRTIKETGHAQADRPSIDLQRRAITYTFQLYRRRSPKLR